MDDDKGLIDKITDSIKGVATTLSEGAKAIAHPSAGTPMDMPLYEAGYMLPKPPAAKRKSAKKSAKTAAKNAPAKKAAKKSTKKAAKRR